MSIINGGIWGPLSWPHPAFVLAVALCGSQLSLAAIWVGAGGGWFPWRLAGFFATVAFWGVLCEMSGSKFAAPRAESPTIHEECLLLEPFFMAWFLLLLRTGNIRLSLHVERSSTASGQAAETPWQFSLSYLLAWMTSTAIILGTVRYLAMEGLPFLPLSGFSDFPGWRSIVALTLCLAVLGPRRRIWALAIAGLLLLPGLLPPFSIRKTLKIAEVTFLVGSFCAIRAAGYRLRRGKFDRALPRQGRIDDLNANAKALE